MQGEDRVETGEKRKEVWNEAFRKLGKFDIDEKKRRKDGDGEIEMQEVEKALAKAERVRRQEMMAVSMKF